MRIDMRTDMPALSRFLIAALACALLAGCSSNGRKPDTQFDLGSPVPRAGMQADAPLPALVVTDATGSAALENERMFYRLDYADGMQARSYGNSRWSASPLELVTLRLRSRLAQMGTKVLQPTDALTGVPVLRLEVDEFVQSFASASQSTGRVVLRASVLREHTLVDQKTFSRATPAATGDAAGGARALSASVDGIADDLARWLAGLNLAAAR
jgi:cholesterol transport system auxiliary component